MIFRAQYWVVYVFCSAMVLAILFRIFYAAISLASIDKTAFLAFPLTVLIPALAFFFLAGRKNMASKEGVLMQLGSMIQLLLIVALPEFALYLALGFPVVFLSVELFETRVPEVLRNRIEQRVLTC